MNKNLLSLFLLLILGVIWGSGYSIAKFATTNGVSPLAYAFWQSLGPAIFVSLMAFGIHRGKVFYRQYFFYYLMCGLLGIAIPNTNMYFTAGHLPSGLLTIVVNTAPILTYLITLIAKLERFYWLRLTGVFFGVLGILCVILPKANLAESVQMHWLLQTLLSPLCFSCCAVYIAKYAPPEVDSLSLASGMLVMSSCLLLPLVLGQNAFVLLHPTQNFPDLMVLVEILLSSLGYVLMFFLLRLAGPVFYSLVAGIVVLTGVFWGGIVFHEQLSFWEIMATLFILLGINLVGRNFVPKKNQKQC